jgi:hypothetical protein
LDCNELADSMSERASVRANDDVLGPVCRGEADDPGWAEMRLRFDETFLKFGIVYCEMAAA